MVIHNNSKSSGDEEKKKATTTRADNWFWPRFDKEIDSIVYNWEMVSVIGSRV